MKKLSSFFMLAGLLMVTLFVFASGPRFASLELYADLGSGNYQQISDPGQSFPELTTSNAGSPTQSTISDRSGATYPLVHGASKQPVYCIRTG